MRIFPHLAFIFLLIGILGATTTVQGQGFYNPLPIPDLIESDTIELTVDTTFHNFDPNGTGPLNSLVTTFAYNKKGDSTGTLLGPSIAWQYLHQLHVEVTNNLSDVTTTHWHGAHVPAYADGGPHQRILPGNTWKIDFEVLDKSATMWYHPHAMDLTYEQVQMGLSGMIYVEDPVDGRDDPLLTAIHDTLPTIYGENDFPIIIQTKQFVLDTATSTYSINQGGFSSGYTYLVNGVVNPYLEVPANMVRLRLLNGDGKFAFNLGAVDANNVSVPFQLIATDAGYTDSTYALNEVLMAPGERTEWLLDLRNASVGDTFYIRNHVSTFPGVPGDIIGDSSTTGGYAVDKNLLCLVIKANTLPPSPISTFPIGLHPLEIPAYDTSYTKKRVKTFYRSIATNPRTGVNTSGSIYNIDKLVMEMMYTNDTVLLDSTEIWEIRNESNRAHPWHIHDIHFYVISVVDSNGNALTADSLPHIFNGPLDNVMIMPGWTLQYVGHFADFGTAIAPDSTYMYHCHILPHEDKGMMGQFVVWNGELVNINKLQEEALDLNAYPNPAQTILHLEGASQEESRVRMIDVQGRVLSTRRLAPFDGVVSVSVSHLPRGVIFVEWINQKGRAVKKIILN